MVKIGQKRKEPKKRIRKKVSLVKKTNRWTVIKRLDIVFSKKLRDKVKNTCEYCGKTGIRVECHHGVVHRRYMNTRYEPDNCICVCGGCHRFLSDFPNINAEFFRKRIGSDRVEQLEILARTHNKLDLEEVEKKIKELE